MTVICIILAAICLFLLARSFCGCCGWRPAGFPPKYDVYPALSIKERLHHLAGDPKWDEEHPHEVEWNKAYVEARKRFGLGAWEPDLESLEKALAEVKREYLDQHSERQAGQEPLDAGFATQEAQKLFEKTVETSKNLKRWDEGLLAGVTAMLQGIEHEYSRLLLPSEELPSYPCREYCLPSMVSDYFPVGVAITPMQPQQPPPGQDSSSDLKPGGSASKIAFGGWIGTADTDALSKQNPNSDDKKNPSPAADPADFNPHQQVTLSISTVLNSPSLLDRIAYVSTYIYFRPFAGPPNRDVVLEKELWKWFCSYYRRQSLHGRPLGPETISNDLTQALEDISVRIENVKTTVDLVPVNMGDLTRKATDSLNLSLAGPPTAASALLQALTSINPKLTAQREVDSTMSQKISQELDHRSTYVNQYANFLRITQRGVQASNLAGRYSELVSLRIPAAHEEIPALVPDDQPARRGEPMKTKLKVKWLSQPLYSRVDAISLSVFVVRQTTGLVGTKRDTFRQDDPTDAAFIVGLSRPFAFTLWQNQRTLHQMMTDDIDSDIEDPLPVYFRIASGANEPPGMRPSPLLLVSANWSHEQLFSLCEKIRQSAEYKAGKLVTLQLDDDNADLGKIEIGLADHEKDPKALKPLLPPPRVADPGGAANAGK